MEHGPHAGNQEWDLGPQPWTAANSSGVGSTFSNFPRGQRFRFFVEDANSGGNHD